MKTNIKPMLMTATLVAILSLNAVSRCAAVDDPKPPMDLGILAGYESSEARGINASGQVVGHCTLGYGEKPFVWQNGVMTQLPLPDGYEKGSAESINNSGVIVGYCGELYGAAEACLWQRVNNTWEVKLLGWPLPYPIVYCGQEFLEGGGVTYYTEKREYTFKGSCGLKINDAGQVLAFTYCTESITGLPDNSQMVGCIWQDDPVKADDWTVLGIAGNDAEGNLVVYPLALFNPAVDMNQEGQILLHAIGNGDEDSPDLWLWQNGTATMLVRCVSRAGLNNSGQIVGSWWDITTRQRNNFTYSIDTGLTQIPSVDESIFTKINDNGQILVTRCFQYGSDMHTDLGIVNWPASDPVTTIGTVPLNFQENLYFNNAGEVCGFGYSPGPVGFHATASTGVMPLNGVATSPEVIVTGMSESGVIIGASTSLADNKLHAFLWGTVPTTYNRAPAANAGTDLTVQATGALTAIALNGSYSSDPDGDNLTFSWTENGTEIATGVNPAVYLAPGSHEIKLTVTDPYGLTASAVVVVTVQYCWSGVLQPIDPPNANGVSPSVFKAGSTVPVKFSLSGASAGITTLTPTFSCANVGSGILGSDFEGVYTGTATAGNVFRYDPVQGQYIFNWSTKGLTRGTYRLSIALGDGVIHTVDVGLK